MHVPGIWPSEFVCGSSESNHVKHESPGTPSSAGGSELAADAASARGAALVPEVSVTEGGGLGALSFETSESKNCTHATV
jgi:hypothetical protein